MSATRTPLIALLVLLCSCGAGGDGAATPRGADSAFDPSNPGDEPPDGLTPYSEFILVEFPEEREVLLDGRVVGKTNSVIAVEGGYCTLWLGGPQDYRPLNVEPEVEDTTSLEPLIVPFELRAADDDE